MIRWMKVLPIALILAACGGQAPEAPAPDPQETPAAAPMAAEADGPPPMRPLPALTIGGFSVEPFYEDEIGDGHFNIAIEGDGISAVRIWAGPEDAVGVMVYRTEIEYGYYHGHLDLPSPLPDDLPLWIEIETTDGETLLGSTPLRDAS